jgi:hypothetical protein
MGYYPTAYWDSAFDRITWYSIREILYTLLKITMKIAKKIPQKSWVKSPVSESNVSWPTAAHGRQIEGKRNQRSTRFVGATKRMRLYEHHGAALFGGSDKVKHV